MKKTKTKWIVLILVAVALFSVAAIFYARSAKKSTDQTQTNNPASSEESQTPASQPTQNAENKYIVSGLNKKDGDFFAVPDVVKFTVSPSVDQTQITLRTSTGNLLFSSKTKGSSGDYTVYPDGKVTTGEKGTLLVEGIKNNKTVVKKEIEVKF